MQKSALQDSLKRSQNNNDSFYDVDNFKKYYPKQYKKWNESSGKEHGWSRVGYGKDEGLYLKKKGHPTINKALKADKNLGYSIYEKLSGKYKGRIYSFPKDKPVDTKVFKRIQ